MKTVRTSENQTILDVAVKYYGTGEAVAEVLDNNPDLRNDASSLAAIGIDYMSDDGFYVDAALAVGQHVVIDDSSFVMNQNVVKELQNKEINTFDL